MSTFQLAVVTPRTAFGEGSRERNLALAREYVAAAAERGASLVCFPESFPGLWRRPVDWTPEAELTEIARENGVYLVGGFTEPVDGSVDRCYNTLLLVGPDGAEIGRYRRTSPAHAPWVYVGGKYWDFDWVTSDELPVFDTPLGRIGLLICSEVYVPELARALALKGAEVIVMPAGLTGPGTLFDTWRTLGWARAIENLAYTAISSNLIGPEQGGLAMICSPESVLVDTVEEGVHVADVDLNRVRWLRGEQDRRLEMAGPRPWRTKPGTLRDWRRQSVLDASPELGQAEVS